MGGESLRCASKLSTVSAAVGATSTGLPCGDPEARKQMSAKRIYSGFHCPKHQRSGMGVDAWICIIYANVLACAWYTGCEDHGQDSSGCGLERRVPEEEADYAQATRHRRVVPRIGRMEDRILRECYLCEAIFGQPGVYESESLYHMLMAARMRACST